MSNNNVEKFFEGRERRELFYQSWNSEGEVKAHIVALHELAFHSDRFNLIAKYLNEKGYTLHAYDLRGHNRSKGDIAGEIDSMDHLQKDLVLFLDLIEKKANGKKIFLLGQGFGALVCLMHAIRHPDLPGVIITSPELGLFGKSTVGKKMLKKLSNSLSQSIEINMDQNQLTSDLKILKLFIKDKNTLKAITGNTASEREKLRKWILSNASQLACPVIILQGGNDKIVDKKKAEKFFKNVKSADKTFKIYDGFLHDLLNEKNRAQVYQDIYVWLEKHV